MRTLSTLMLAGVLASPASAQTVRTVLDNGPPEERFDIVILAEGYLASEESTFNNDVDDLLAYLFGFAPQVSGLQPFERYREYFNVRSYFQASTCNVCSCPSGTATTYGVQFVTDATQPCADIATVPLGAFPINDVLVRQHADIAGGADPGGILVLVNSPTNRNYITYGGIAFPSDFGIATNNRSARTNFNLPTNTPPGSLPLTMASLSDLKFPELAAHELGHTIGVLADETGTFGAAPGCSTPELPDYLEVNVTMFPNRNRFVRWASQWDLSTLPERTGGLGVYGNCGFPSGTTAGVYHMNSHCMMNLLDAPFCAVCREQMAIQIHAQAELTPNLLTPPVGTPQLTLSLTDGITLGFDPLVVGGPKDVRWERDGVQFGGGPQTNVVTQSASTPGVVRFDVRIEDRAEATTSFNSNMVSSIRLDEMTFEQEWTVNFVDDAVGGPEIWSITGPDINTNRLGATVVNVGDFDGDGLEDLGVTSETKVAVIDGQSGQAFFDLGPGCSTCRDPRVVGLEDRTAGPNLVAIAGMNQLTVELYSYTPAGPSLRRTLNVGHHPMSMANLGDVDGDQVDDIGIVGFNTLEVFSGDTGVLLHSSMAAERTPPASNLGRMIAGLQTDAGQDNDGRPDFVVFEEDPGNAPGRWIRCRSGRWGFVLWELQLEDWIDAYVSETGDVNADGVGDFLLTLPLEDNRVVSEAGIVTLRSGVDGSVLQEYAGSFNGKKLGLGVAGLGDVTGDGVPDFAMTRREFPASSGAKNLVDVISGATDEVVSTFSSAYFKHGEGAGITSIGDLNGDGRPDIAIADAFGSSFNPDGRVTVYSVEPLVLAQTTIVGSGCAGSNGTPKIDGLLPNDLPRLGSNFTMELRGLPLNSQPVFGMFSFFEAEPALPLDVIGMPGCELFLDGEIFSFPLTSSGGQATWTFPISSDPVFLGATFMFQGFVTDAGVNPFNATTTNGLRATIGL